PRAGPVDEAHEPDRGARSFPQHRACAELGRARPLQSQLRRFLPPGRERAVAAPRSAFCHRLDPRRSVSVELDFTLGIEEEYFLVDRVTRDVVTDPPDTMLAEYEALLGGQVSPEFLRSQV